MKTLSRCLLLPALFLISSAMQAQWIQVSVTPRAELGRIMNAGTRLLSVSTKGGLYYSDDYGRSWNILSYMRNGENLGAKISNILVRDGDIYAFTGPGIFLSRDRGASWDSIATAKKENGELIGSARHFFYFNGNNKFTLLDGGSIYQASDPSSVWTQTGSAFLAGQFVYSDTAFYKFGTADLDFWLEKSYDAGKTWQYVLEYRYPEQGLIGHFSVTEGKLYVELSDGILVHDEKSGLSGKTGFSGLQKARVVDIVRNTVIVAARKMPENKQGLFIGKNPQSVDITGNLPAPQSSYQVAGKYVFASLDTFGMWRRSLEDVLDFSDLTPRDLLPPSGTKVMANDITLRWSRVEQSFAYHLQVSGDPAFLSDLAVDDSAVAATSYRVRGLKTNTKYYWRVRAVLGEALFTKGNEPNDILASAEWSEPRDFMTGAVVNDVSELNTARFSLNVFPNPAGEKATLRFWLEHPSSVKIKCINHTGETISSLVQQEFPSGDNTIAIEAQDYPAGSYYIRFELDGMILYRKFVIER